jgi:DNA-directed RNA polymerase subunit RPC12/RpoP
LKFLGRARRFLQELASEPESKVQYFNVTCASGHRVRGERTEGYQALRCPACGEGVFVLPRSPLPNPVAPARSQTDKAVGPGMEWVEEGPVELTEAARVTVDVADNGRDEAEIIWEDEVETSSRHDRAGIDSKPPKEPPGAPAARSRGKSGQKRSQTPDGGIDRGAEAQTDHKERRPAARVERQPRSGRPPAGASTQRGQLLEAPAQAAVQTSPELRRRRYHRLIVVLIPLLVVLSVGWRYWRSKRLEYPLILERARTEGIPALEEGNFNKANQHLSAAKAAVDALGGAVDDADEIRTAAAEAAIFVDQAPVSLEEMLDQANRTDKDSWASKFSTLYKGRAIVIDSWVVADADKGGGAPCELLYRVLPQGATTSFNVTETGGARHQLSAEIGLAGFQLFEITPPKPGERVTFGARLAAFEYDDAKDNWVVRLEPKSGVFIIHTKALQALGWPSVDAVVIPREE